MAFELSYAGVPFSNDEPGVVAWMQKNMPLIQESIALPPGSFPGPNVLRLGLPNWPPYPNLKIGDWFYPNGASRWSVFHGLATGTQVLQMQSLALSATGPAKQTFVMQADAYGNPTFAAQKFRNTSPMWMLPPRVLSWHFGAPDNLYLVTLVDERFYWQWTPTSELHSGGSWNSYISSLLSSLSIPATVIPTIPAAYGQPEEDSDLYVNLENAAQVLDAVCFNVGLTVVRHLDGTYALTNNTGDDNTITSNRPANPTLRISGGDMFGSEQVQPALPVQAIMPASVTVTFPKWISAGDAVTPTRFYDPSVTAFNNGPSGWVKDSYRDVWQEVVTVAQAAAIDPALGNLVGVPNTTKVFRDTAKAVYTVSPPVDPPTNEAALRALAVQAAADFYGNLTEGLDETYPGTLVWAPEGVHDLLWSYRKVDGMGSLRVIPKPWNFAVADFAHGFGQQNVIGTGFWAQLNGLISLGPPASYQFFEVTDDGNGNMVAVAGGRSDNAKANPLYQTNGTGSTLPFGEVVWAVPSITKGSYEFWFPIDAGQRQPGVVSLQNQYMGQGDKYFGSSGGVGGGVHPYGSKVGICTAVPGYDLDTHGNGNFYFSDDPARPNQGGSVYCWNTVECKVIANAGFGNGTLIRMDHANGVGSQPQGNLQFFWYVNTSTAVGYLSMIQGNFPTNSTLRVSGGLPADFTGVPIDFEVFDPLTNTFRRGVTLTDGATRYVGGIRVA